MLTPPHDLSDGALISVLARRWALVVDSMSYQPVGFGSHHWEVVDVNGARRFVTVDDLDLKRNSGGEPLDAAVARLSASLTTARDLRDSGRGFVVAPIPTLDGEPLAIVGDRFAVALYPFIDGQSFPWGDFLTLEHRHATLDLIVSVHTAPRTIHRHAMIDNFEIPYRDDVEAAFDPVNDVGDCGPYARSTHVLLIENAMFVQRVLARYDELVTIARTQPARMVLTHGEPHPGNTMRTSTGWLLIDWDTALVAPPERDLWHLDPGDGSILAAYTDATGVTLLAQALELYRVQWDLADIAISISRFRRHHPGSLDDDKSWEILRSLVGHLDAYAA